LRFALEKAKAANMPRANVDRAIERGLGSTKSGQSLDEVVYEGYGPGGVGFLVTTITDNRNRTGSEIRTCFDHHGGSLGGPGSAGYLFTISPDGSKTVKIPLQIEDNSVRAQVEGLVELLENQDDVEEVVHNME
jgi:transcriptional/translational regulatory protein YebC/TACO1